MKYFPFAPSDCGYAGTTPVWILVLGMNEGLSEKKKSIYSAKPHQKKQAQF